MLRLQKKKAAKEKPQLTYKGKSIRITSRPLIRNSKIQEIMK
jgi:hypothetical protein